MLFAPTVSLRSVKVSEERTSDNQIVQHYRFGKLVVTVSSNELSPKAVKTFNDAWNDLANTWVDQQERSKKTGVPAA